MRIIRRDELIETTWKNGQGVTREIACETVDTKFLWRLSLADVASDGPFSDFSGLIRELTVIKGRGMALETPDITIQANPLMPVRFDGDLKIFARLNSGASTNLNFIFNPLYCDGAVGVLLGPHQQTLSPTLSRTFSAHCVKGTLSINQDILINTGDTAVSCDRGFEIELSEGGIVILITIDQKPAPIILTKLRDG